MRVMIVGGSDVHLRIPMADRLAGYKVESVLVGTDPTGTIARGHHEFRRMHLRPADIALGRFGRSRSLEAAARSEKVDVVQLFDTVPGLVGGARSFDVPVVRTVTGRGRNYRTGDSSRRTVVYSIANRRRRAAVSHWVFQNEKDRTWFRSQGIVGQGESTIIPGSGVDLCAFRPPGGESEIAELRRTLGLPASGCIALMVSRVVPRKGVELFAAAARSNYSVETHFVLVGGRSNRFRPDLTGVIELGERSDIPELMRACDIVVLPTEYGEGLPRVLLEGAASARPLVTTNAPGCSEVVRDQETGLLVEANPSSLTKAIEVLARDPEKRARYGHNAKLHVETGFDIDSISARYYEIYARLAAS